MAPRWHGSIMTSHNPDPAFLCCSNAILITRNGSVVSGSVDDVVTEENLRRAGRLQLEL